MEMPGGLGLKDGQGRSLRPTRFRGCLVLTFADKTYTW